jgi:hypothetical protein
MPYVVQIESSFRARQGLASPTRSDAGLPSLDDAGGRSFVLRVGLEFADEAVDNRAGRALDSDIVSLLVERTTNSLSAEPWTTLFEFRTSLERVSRHVYDTLAVSVQSLSYVEIRDGAAGLTVRYQP